MFIRGDHTTAVSVGEVIMELLDARGWTIKDFAQRIGYSEEQTLKIMDGEIRVTDKIAKKFETIFSISAKSWIKFDELFIEDKSKILTQ